MMTIALTEHSRLKLESDEAPYFPGLSVEMDRAGYSLKAGGRVGLFPGHLGERQSLVVVYPKGCHVDASTSTPSEGLRRFFQMWMLAHGGSPSMIGDADDWAIKQRMTPAQTFPYFLAVAYARVLRDLCGRDFRKAYQPHSETLRGRVRGRLNRHRHISNTLRGRGHHLPCAWEEFTADNWDNRILKAAMIRLLRQCTREGIPGHRLFAPVRGAFEEVADVPVSRRTFALARLGRLSSYYRAALELAAAILLGGEASAGQSLRGNAQEAQGREALRISTHDTFERFCQRILKEAVRPLDSFNSGKVRLPALLSSSSHSIEPDLAIQDKSMRFCAVGDAKYKRVVRALEERSRSGEDVERIQALAIQTGDQYQLYSYLRLVDCPIGFFMIPFWDVHRESVACCPDLTFRRSPLDGDQPHAVRVVALNLMKSPAAVMKSAADVVRSWLDPSAPELSC